MKQIKELFKNKKFVIGTVAVILLATVGTVFALNQPQTKNEVAQQETISDEEHAKLLANIKKLQSEDQKKTATVAPTEVKEEEKPTVEQPKKEEVKQKEENKNTQPVQPQPKKEVKVEQKPVPKVEQSKPVVKPEVPKSLPKPPVASAKPTPTPAPEKPKQIKYCNYTGNRKPIQNICNNGAWDSNTPTGWDPNSYVVKKAVQRVLDGTVEQMVFHGETERYHLIEDDYLRNGLKKTTGSFCFIEGSCVGFKLP